METLAYNLHRESLHSLYSLENLIEWKRIINTGKLGSFLPLYSLENLIEWKLGTTYVDLWFASKPAAVFVHELERIIGFPIVNHVSEDDVSWAIEEVALKVASFYSLDLECWLLSRIKMLAAMDCVAPER